MSRPPGLLYSVDETPPRAVLIAAGLQQAALMSTSLLYPIILGREAHLSPDRLLDFVSVSMLSLAIATLLLCTKSRFIGSGYLCPGGCSQLYLGPSVSAAHIGGLPLVFGMTVVTGILQTAIAPVLRRVRFLLPPEIAGLVIAVVGLFMAVLGVRYSLSEATSSTVMSEDLAIAAVSLTTMVILNVWTKGFLRMFCLLLGVAVGYGASAAFGILDFSTGMPSQGLPLLRLPSLELLQWRFDASLIAPFAIIAIAGILNLTANVSYAQRINDADWVRPNFSSLSRGLLANGIAMVVSATIGSMGINTYSSSVGLSAATGVTSRSLAYVISIVFALLSLMPAAAALITTIPAPVVGAAFFFAAAFVFASGIQAITARLLDSRKIIVIGFSFAMAMLPNTSQDLLAHAPGLFHPILESGLVLGTVSAVLLNLLMRIGVRQRVTMKLEPGHVDRETIEQFLSEQGGRWGARRDIISRAIFGVVQVLEVVDHGSEVEASFDEFNLDIRIRYAGTPLLIPDRRPTPREIVASEDGERLLAGYLLRQTADRVNCKASGGGTVEVQLHYDH
ncbi:MAG TPA: solute carrier family 23 protein [Pseudolabrys sp.]|nr:solute carrier family 23 protein [Pseudolabrys sp.]